MDFINIIYGIVIVLVIELIIFLIFKMFFRKTKNEKLSEDELKDLVAESHEQGVLLASEADMIQNIFDFDEKDAKDIMIHRKEIVALDSTMTLGDTISFVNENHFSRYPVYENDLENIIGILHLKDILKEIQNNTDFGTQLKDIEGILRPAEFIPETHGIHTLITRMQSQKYQMVIVVDEYGQTSGLLSMEDILEEIVGNIFDEYDDDDEHISIINEDIFKMEGRTPLDEAAKILGVDFEGVEYETLNGLLTHLHGQVPADNDKFKVTAYGYDFFVEDVKQRMALSVVVKRHATLETN